MYGFTGEPTEYDKIEESCAVAKLISMLIVFVLSMVIMLGIAGRVTSQTEEPEVVTESITEEL